MQIEYRVEWDPRVLNREVPATGHGIAAAVLAAYNAFVGGRHGWDISKLVPEFEEVPVTIYPPDDRTMTVEERHRWIDALTRFGLKEKTQRSAL